MITSNSFVKLVQHKYAILVAVMRKIMHDVTIDNFSKAKKKLAEKIVEKAIIQHDLEMVNFANLIIRKAYNERKKQMQVILKRKKYNKVDSDQVHNEKVIELQDGLGMAFLKANKSIKKTAQSYLDLTEQAVDYLQNPKIQEFNQGEFDAGIDDIVKANINTSLGTIKKNIKQYFNDSFGDLDVIIIGERMYKISSYLEMLARTEIIDVLTQASIETCKQWGDDLVQFSHHDSPCEICSELEGEIFSISGDSEKYPELSDDATPPVHPNCEHNLNPVSFAEAS